MELAPADLSRTTFLRLLGSLRIVRKARERSKRTQFSHRCNILLDLQFLDGGEVPEVSTVVVLTIGQGADEGILPDADYIYSNYTLRNWMLPCPAPLALLGGGPG